MQTEALFQLINPFVFIIVAVALFLLGRARAELRTINWFALGYLFAAIAFALDISRNLMPLLLGAVLVDLTYTLCCLWISIGLVKRVGGKVPVQALALILLLHAIGFVAFRVIYNDLLMLDISTNFFSGLLFAVGAMKAWRLTQTWIEKAVNIVFLAFAVNLILRPLMVAWFVGRPESIEAFTSSATFVTLHLAAGVFAIAGASSLFAAYVVKLIGLLRCDAETDVLTGLLNRRGLRRFADQLQLAISEDTEAVFVILADLDRFKQVNDTYGHTFGDQLICKAADLFTCPKTARAECGRVGGEEFALIFAAGSLEDAKARAEDLRSKLAATEMSTPVGPRSFTASFGVAQLPPDGSLTDALECADEALYLAKKTGRNRVATQQDVVISKLQKQARTHLEGALTSPSAAMTLP